MILTLAACGASTAAPHPVDPPAEASAQWTPELLDKLDPVLRRRVRDAPEDRVAVKVFFHELPPDSVLGSLYLTRVGELGIGRVDPRDLVRIAARRDVDRIEELEDTGYDTL